MRIVGTNNWVGELPLSVQAEIRSRQVVRELNAGEVIGAAGEEALFIYQVLEGCVKLVSETSEGERVLLAIYVKGNCFTETAVISERNLIHTTVSATPSKIAYLRRDDFYDLYLSHPEIPQALCRKFALTITRSVRFRDVKADYSLPQQLRIVFEDLGLRTGNSKKNNEVEIPVPLTIAELSSFLGVTRQTIQKEISLLKKQGLLDKREGLWVVRDMEKISVMSHLDDLLCDEHD